MCDGSRNLGGLVLCTDNFSVADVVKLINVLRSKWNIESTINYSGGKPRIQMNAKQLPKIQMLVNDHMIDHFKYKVKTNK
jgi:hypothetical protein